MLQTFLAQWKIVYHKANGSRPLAVVWSEWAGEMDLENAEEMRDNTRVV
jgi:hypothetical protein